MIVGETVTAGLLYADADGITNSLLGIPAPIFGWYTDDQLLATGQSYTITSAEEGKVLYFKLGFTDDAGNFELSNSYAFWDTPVAAGNNLAAGELSISGLAKQYQTLTSDTSLIADADGLGSFSYQWLRDESEINGATSVAYTLTQQDVGAQISVKISFTDGAGNSEEIVSAETSAVTNVNDNPSFSTSPSLAATDDIEYSYSVLINDLDGRYGIF
jgi:hypothetical protein